ncbi:FAD-binding protein, partial [Escherichia coli]|nr:FAD-binding protein [Escherichia coli]
LSAVGKYLVDGLLKNVQEQKIPVFVNADVKEITQKDGKVTGVKVKLNNKDEKTISSNAVVVTTGGYGANKDMIEKERPDLK